MANFVKLPDGSLFPAKEGEDYATAMRAAYAAYPEAFGGVSTTKAPESGFTPALKAGFENLKGDVAALAGRAGLMDLSAAEKYKAEKEAEAQKIFKPTEEGWTEAPLTKLKELAGGSLPYMAAPLAAGAAAAAAPVTGLAGAALTAGATGLTSAAQFTGSNLSRQMDEGKTLAETDLGAAALAAIPQAALDVVSLKMIPGVRNILAAGGRKVSEETAQAAAQQGIKNIAADYAKATGKTMSIEGLTEAGQQVFERLQAGLSLTDSEARKEYWDNFLGGAVLGGTLAPAGRFVERGQEQAKDQELKAEQARKAAEAAAQAEEAAKTAPDRRLAELEAQTAQQPTASQALPSDVPDAAPYQMANVLNLTDSYQQLKGQLAKLQEQYTQGADIATQQKLEKQMEEVEAHMNDLAPAIERMGGSTMPVDEINKALAASEKKRLDAMAIGDIKAAKKHAGTIQDLQSRLEVAQKGATPKGETLGLPLEEPAQPKQEGLQYTAPTEAKPEPVKEIAPKQLADVQSAQKQVNTAQQQLDNVLQTSGTKDTNALYQAIDAVNQAQDTSTRAQENIGRPTFKPAIIDLFDPANVLQTAIANGDSKVLNDIAAHADRTTLRQALDQASTDRERLVKILDSKLNLEGQTRERVDLFSKMYNPKQQALFKNGTYPDKNLQSIFDQGGPSAVEYENILQDVEALQKKVTTKQGNAKQSLYEQLVALAAEHEALKAQLESGIAKPTMGEKTAKLQAQLGKGEAPAEGRQMDAAERYQAERRLTAIENKYKLVEGKVLPIRDQVKALWDSMYKTTPAEKPSVIAERKKAEATEAAKGPKAKTRAAATAARIARGDVRYEAENSTKMRQLAMELGMEEAEYDKFGEGLMKRVRALEEKYGKNDPAVTAFRIQMSKDLEAKALEIGKKTPEYKATLKEQTEIVREALSQSKQTLPTKRTGQVTRKQTGAPSRLRSASPESRAEGEAENERSLRSTLKDFKDAIAAEKSGTAYRLREDGTEQVVDAAEAQKVIDGLKLPDNVKFVYAPTTGNIPVRLLNLMAKEGVDPNEGMVQGAVFPDGTVLVVGDQHADVKDLEETIAHELIGHYGIDTVIGLDRLNAFAKKTDVIELAERLGGKKLVAEVMNTVRANADIGRSEEVQKLQALREIIAHTSEARITESFREKAGRWLKELVGMVRAGLRDMGLKNLAELSTSDVFYMLKQSRKAFESKQIGPYKAADGGVAFRRRSEPSEYGIGRPAGVVDTMLGNMMGLAGRVQFVDQYAAIEAAAKKGLAKGVISSLEAVNANYLLRFGQQRSQFAGQFLTNGPVRAVHTKKDGGVETVYQSNKGVSMMDVAKRVGEAGIGNDTEQEDMFTLYLAGKRANQVGWDKLNYTNPNDAKAKYEKMMAVVNANSKAKEAFEDAAKMYQKYNAGLLDFLVDTGALSKGKADELKAISYVPFYRVNGDGEVQLVIDKEKSPVRIANIKDQPQLQQLVGGNTEIMPIFTSAAQNTFMLTGMGLRNQAVKETSFMLQKLGIASRVSSGMGPKGENVVRFFKHGEPYYALIDTDAYGIPADLIVKGMEGIKTSMPAVVKALGIPSQLLRNFVVRMPTYALRQIIRDPLNAWLTTGTDAAPILSSMKELASMVAGRSDAERKLMESGAISSNVYSGDEADMGKFLQDIAAGKSMWEKAIGRLDAFALQGDAATRAVVYKDSLAKGMTEQEALLRTLESMNFSRRGVSPSMHALSVMIPFFNAQVQGLDVIYRAFKGDMPFSEQTKIRAKMVQRGMMLAAGTIAYAAMMEDDEAYKRAKPEERYANWFVYVPGVSEPVRVPIPFEMGFLFKALPEAVWNSAMQDDKASKAAKGLGSVFMQTVPNPVPQAIKPAVEAVLGKSFYGGDIESAREKEMLATDRYRENTTELSKLIGAVTGKAGVSPIMLDYLVRGYTGGLGIALVQLANPLLASDARDIAQPTTKPSKLPLIGGLFQPVEGRGTLDESYDRMMEIRQIKGTYNKLVEEGRRAEAKEFAQNYANDLAAMSVSGSVQKQLGEIAKYERMVKASPTLTTEQKDAELEKLDKLKMRLATKFLAFSDKTTRQ